jgi:Tol biopolymer transport system component
VANADGSDRRAITFPDTSFFDEGLVWSPDGQWIAFHRNGPAVCQGAAPLQPRRCLPHWRLFVIRPDGRELRPLTPDSLQATWPDW